MAASPCGQVTATCTHSSRSAMDAVRALVALPHQRAASRAATFTPSPAKNPSELYAPQGRNSLPPEVEGKAVHMDRVKPSQVEELNRGQSSIQSLPHPAALSLDPPMSC